MTVGLLQTIISGFLSVTDRLKQLKMNPVFNINNHSFPPYIYPHFNRLEENITRMTTKASATDFFLPRDCEQGTSTFFYSDIKECTVMLSYVKI